MNILHVAGGVGTITANVKRQHNIIGNIEDRKEFHTGTFEFNYPGAFMVKGLHEVPEIKEHIDLIVGHPKCGNFSSLNTQKKNNLTSNFQLFKDCIDVYQPTFFFFDNLLKSLKTFPKEYWIIKGYDLQFIEVNNWDYGNCQIRRKRLFVLGSKKDYKFEHHIKLHNTTLKDVIGDLPKYDVPQINHVFVKDDEKIPEFTRQNFGLSRGQLTHKVFSDIVEDFVYNNYIHVYYLNGHLIKKPEYKIMPIELSSNTLTSRENNFLKVDNKVRSLTIRERARIQGIPDSFIFKVPNRKHGLLQTGAAVPTEFTTYLINSISKFIKK